MWCWDWKFESFPLGHNLVSSYGGGSLKSNTSKRTLFFYQSTSSHSYLGTRLVIVYRLQRVPASLYSARFGAWVLHLTKTLNWFGQSCTPSGSKQTHWASNSNLLQVNERRLSGAQRNHLLGLFANETRIEEQQWDKKRRHHCFETELEDGGTHLANVYTILKQGICEAPYECRAFTNLILTHTIFTRDFIAYSMNQIARQIAKQMGRIVRLNHAHLLVFYIWKARVSCTSMCEL